MSRMMDSLVKAIKPDVSQDPGRPNLQIVRGGIVPSPEVAAEIRLKKRKKSQTQIARAGGGIVLVALLALGSWLTISYLRGPGETHSPSQDPSQEAQAKAVELLRAGSYQEAEAALASLLRTNPALRAARVNHAFALKQLGRFEESQKQYEEVIVRHGREPVTLNNLAVLHLAMGQLSKAEALLQEALELKPDYHQARLNLATTLEQAGRTATALEAYRLYLSSARSEPLLLDRLKNRSRKLHSFVAGNKPGQEKL